MRILKKALFWLPLLLWSKWFRQWKLVRNLNFLMLAYAFLNGFNDARKDQKRRLARGRVIDI